MVENPLTRTLKHCTVSPSTLLLSPLSPVIHHELSSLVGAKVISIIEPLSINNKTLGIFRNLELELSSLSYPILDVQPGKGWGASRPGVKIMDSEFRKTWIYLSALPALCATEQRP